MADLKENLKKAIKAAKLEEKLSPEEVIELIEKLSEQSEDEKDRKFDSSTLSEVKDNLSASLTELNKKHTFQLGQFVKWKKGLKNKRRPYDGEPAIVIALLKEPLRDSDTHNSVYFREPLDILLGVWEKDSMLIFHHNKSKFEPY